MKLLDWLEGVRGLGLRDRPQRSQAVRCGLSLAAMDDLGM